ncbi:sensor histidine kinase [Ureibacillus chungkukjangi]|uniref:histidine kinase n=1 Tax=Ureibacillus chungkukjangi TaxID=1202712 RepID=A0A318U0T0_9BACL|nr:sensor histidine kinase [Ureibacillus chungkukjangi]PYF08005.1 signal transduction histidine kinase [Ureibacillus chungkukjangi]
MFFLLFLKERWAWISYILLLILFINIVFFLDAGLSGISISYFNIVTLMLSFSFFIWRYIKETQGLAHFLGNLSNPTEFLYSENTFLSPFQRKYFDEVLNVIEQKDTLLNQSRVKVQEDAESQLAWVHEMKTPLTAMKLMIEQVNDAKLRYRIENEWMRTHLLLDQQLHHTRLASIEKDNRLERVILKSIIFKEIREFQTWCMEKGIGFQTAELDKEVVSDNKWLAFIVRQILSNAIKYSHENSEIDIYTEVDELGHLLLHVKDCGRGIRAEDLPRIFQKSYTGTIGRESVQSTGMGLYLAKNAAVSLGIKISVESKLNEGSIFTLKFPLQNEYHSSFDR